MKRKIRQHPSANVQHLRQVDDKGQLETVASGTFTKPGPVNAEASWLFVPCKCLSAISFVNVLKCANFRIKKTYATVHTSLRMTDLSIITSDTRLSEV